MKKEEFVKKGSKINFKNKYINGFINNYFTVILKNWIFQGFFDLSINEKIYKILFDCLIIYVAYILGANTGLCIIIAFLIAHTLNWITNDHFIDNLYHLQICKTTPESMERAVQYLQKFVNKFGFIIYAGIYGRIARGDEVRLGTDIDIRLITEKGFINSIAVCFIGHYLRCIALFKLIPLDINIWNKPGDLRRMRKDENPLVIKDTANISAFYSEVPNNMLPKYKKYDVRFK